MCFIHVRWPIVGHFRKTLLLLAILGFVVYFFFSAFISRTKVFYMRYHNIMNRISDSLDGYIFLFCRWHQFTPHTHNRFLSMLCLLVVVNSLIKKKISFVISQTFQFPDLLDHSMSGYFAHTNNSHKESLKPTSSISMETNSLLRFFFFLWFRWKSFVSFNCTS